MSTNAIPFFPEIDRIPFVGGSEGLRDSDGNAPLGFRVYDPDREVLGRRMEDHLRFAVCYWHTFCWPGADVFGDGTLDRPWHAAEGDAMAMAHQKLDVAFEFFSKLGVPYFCFHDRDIAPEAKSFRETAARLPARSAADRIGTPPHRRHAPAGPRGVSSTRSGCRRPGAH